MNRRLFISPELENYFGPLDADIKRRLTDVHRDPQRYWNRDHGIILTMDGLGLTLWQAIMKVDPTFPKVGPSSDSRGKMVEDWQRYPTQQLIEQALLYAAPKKGQA